MGESKSVGNFGYKPKLKQDVTSENTGMWIDIAEIDTNKKKKLGRQG